MRRGTSKRLYALNHEEYEINAEKEAQMFDMLAALKKIFTIPGIAKATELPKFLIDKYTSRTKAIVEDEHLDKIKTVYSKWIKFIDMFDDYIKVSSIYLPFDVRNKLHAMADKEGKKLNTVMSEAIINHYDRKNQTEQIILP